MSASLAVLGLLFLAAAALIVIADSGGMSARMPTQVPPRRVARYPLVIGLTLLVLSVVARTTS